MSRRDDRDFVRIFECAQSVRQIGVEPTAAIVCKALGWYPRDWTDKHSEMLAEALDILHPVVELPSRFGTYVQTYRRVADAPARKAYDIRVTALYAERTADYCSGW